MRIGKWHVISNKAKDKRGQTLNHVKCIKCGTVRILTTPEAESEYCEC